MHKPFGYLARTPFVPEEVFDKTFGLSVKESLVLETLVTMRIYVVVLGEEMK